MCVRRYTEAAISAFAIAIERGGGKKIDEGERERERGGKKKGKIVFKIAGCPSNMERTERREIIGRRFRAYRGAHPEIYIGTRHSAPLARIKFHARVSEVSRQIFI